MGCAYCLSKPFCVYMKPAAVASFQPKTVLFWEIFAIEDTIVTCNLFGYKWKAGTCGGAIYCIDLCKQTVLKENWQWISRSSTFLLFIIVGSSQIHHTKSSVWNYVFLVCSMAPYAKYMAAFAPAANGLRMIGLGLGLLKNDALVKAMSREGGRR